MIDTVVLMVLLLVVARLVRLAAFFDESDRYAPTIVASMFCYLSQSFLLEWRGQTVGKMIVRTRVVRLDGGRPSFVQIVLLRYLLLNAIQLALQFLVYKGAGSWIFLIDGLFIYRGTENRCLHDVIAGTQVVDLKASGVR